MRWKFRSWEDGVFSTLRVTLDAEGDSATLLTLEQTHIPMRDRFGNVGCRSSIEGGWREQVLRRVSHFLGFSINYK